MVIASDGGDPAKSGSMIVSIKVVDANDNAPVFDNSTYEVVSVCSSSRSSSSSNSNSSSRVVVLAASLQWLDE